MKINKIRSKLHFLKKRRNENDSTCVYVAWFYCLLASRADLRCRYKNASKMALEAKTVKHATQSS